MIYSRRIVSAISFLVMKLKGGIALYRLRALVKNVGGSSKCHLSVELKYPERIVIKDHVYIGPDVTLGGHGSITIENYVRISKGATLETASLDLNSDLPYTHISAPIIVKEGAWLGAKCVILGGVTIGKKAVIGAGTIVSKDVADNSVIVSQQFRTLR